MVYWVIQKNKVPLISLILTNASRPVANLLDTPAPPISAPILPSSPIVKSRKITSFKTIASRIYNTVKEKVKDFAGCILNHVPPVPEIVDRKLK